MKERVDSSNSAQEISDFSPTETNLSPEREVFRTLSAPVTLQWEQTGYCNHNCEHCYNFWRQDEEPQKLVITPETIEVYEDTVDQIIENEVFQVTITGGEPLSVFKWTYPLMQKLSEADVGISLNSNLTMLNREKAKLLKSLGVRSILTSLMSPDPELNDRLAGQENAHRNTVRGIQIAQEEGFWVAVNMVVTKKNLGEIYEMAEYVKSLGINSFAATKASTPITCPDFSDYMLSPNDFRFMVNELLRVRDNLDINADSLEFYPMCFFEDQETRDFAGNRMCNAGKTACTIGPDGLVRPCSHANQVYGSVLEGNEGLNKAWLNLQDWRTERFIPEECNECSVRNVCRGGCRTEAFAASGNLEEPDPYAVFSRPPLEMSPPKDIQIEKSTRYEFHKGIKTRKEDFGGIIFITPVRWSAVTERLLSFYNKFAGASFTIRDLAEGLGVSPEEVNPTAKILARKTIIKERR